MLERTDTSTDNTSETPMLQPMGVGDILDTTFSLYRKHFLMFLGLTSIYFFGLLLEYSLRGFITEKTQKALISALAAMPFAIVSMGGVVFASATVYLGNNTTSSASLRQVFRRFFPMLWSHLIWRLTFVISFVSFSALMLLIVRRNAIGMLTLFVFPLCIYYMVCWVFHMPIVLLEEPRVIYALRRSSELVRSKWWQILGILILILLASYAIAIIFKLSLGFILIFTKLAGNTDLRNIVEWSILETVLDSDNFLFYAIMTCTDLIMTALVFPIWVIGVTLLYFDRRVRKEGYDIELTANNPIAI
jgi:hypothetical protein